METVKVKGRPILFSGKMVRAILEGRKTQTRRPIKPQPDELYQARTRSHGFGHGHDGIGWYFSDYEYPEEGTTKWSCPYGEVGDLIWVRETWAHVFKSGGMPIGQPARLVYRADLIRGDGSFATGPWTPSIHMPRWASRINLEITHVRVGRIQEITEMDARHEGYRMSFGPCGGGGMPGQPRNNRDLFRDSWNATYPGSWDRNDWVWVVEFKVMK